MTESRRPSRLTIQIGSPLAQQILLLVVAAIAVIGIHAATMGMYTGDYTGFTKLWFEHLRETGFFGLGEPFADYNMPYLYLLLLGSYTPLDGLAVTKIIALVADVGMAVGVGAIAWRLRSNLFLASVLGMVTLFLPEVLLNSAVWGQSDSVFTAFLVWAVYFMLRKRDVLVWVFFALAFAVKLQAVFLLPWILVVFLVQRHRWRAIGAAVLVLVAGDLPALIAGRSITSLVSVYVQQTGTYSDLVLFTPTLYQWLPQSEYNSLRSAGVFFALGVTALYGALLLRRGVHVRESGRWLIQAAAAFAALIPFVLPQMHDRYFYAAGVLTFVCAVLDRRYLLPALVLQFTAVMAYSHFLFGVEPVVPFGILAIVQLGTVGWVCWLALNPIERLRHPYFPREPWVSLGEGTRDA